jgi:hypothetical protein
MCPALEYLDTKNLLMPVMLLKTVNNKMESYSPTPRFLPKIHSSSIRDRFFKIKWVHSIHTTFNTAYVCWFCRLFTIMLLYIRIYWHWTHTHTHRFWNSRGRWQQICAKVLALIHDVWIFILECILRERIKWKYLKTVIYRERSG